ncbi:Flp family type IVb pilin [Raineyella sp. LH-20]|uniref:Flp family type IVb pilin n=1 Tax=Raineyella sp. LH-20 TaxID=3081204 RepID=UPI002955B578|nr:Flp family type IVb pilin [Raineyella sp. LH-20]WOP17745.1 Flp family type IVb pilin [Raineyella sp. LH-20]
MTKFAAFVSTTLFMLNSRLENKDKGATMVEYGLLVALIAIAAIVGVTAVGTDLLALFNSVAAKL